MALTNGNTVNSSPSLLDEDDDEARILQTLDELREHGLDRITDLPQIIVCGSQSAGKSSTLEAISGLHFPSGDGTCTRFITQVTLKRHHEAFVTARIIPAAERPSHEKQQLAAFERRFSADESAVQLPSVFADARSLILDSNISNKSTKFTRDRLCITSCGPKRRPLQLIDLPGLIQFDGADSSDTALSLVKTLTTDEMARPNSIILAVVKTTEDYNNAPILALCRAHDPTSTRSIIVATCPDVNAPGVDSYARLLCGTHPDPTLNPAQWHVLRNRSRSEIEHGLDRDQTEAGFFSRDPRWSPVPVARRGVSALTERLRGMLFRVARAEIPRLRDQVRQDLNQTRLALRELGGGDACLSDTALAGRFRKALDNLRYLAHDHARGHYELLLLLDRDPRSALRLRSRVVEDSERFRDRLLAYGHVWERRVLGADSLLTSERDSSTGEKERDSAEEALLTKLTRNVFPTEQAEIQHAADLLAYTRNTNLPGFAHPIVDEIFWKLSGNWPVIAESYLETVYARCCEYFVRALPLALADPGYDHEPTPTEEQTGYDGSKGFHNAGQIAERYRHVILSRMAEARDRARRELKILERERTASPINYLPRFEAELRRHREQDLMRGVNRLLERRASPVPNGSGTLPPGGNKDFHTPSSVAEDMGLHGRTQNPKWDPRDCARAAWIHYDIARDQYLTNVIVQVVERHLLAPFRAFVPDEIPPVHQLREMVRGDELTERQRVQLDGRARVLAKSLEVLEL